MNRMQMATKEGKIVGANLHSKFIIWFSLKAYNFQINCPRTSYTPHLLVENSQFERQKVNNTYYWSLVVQKGFEIIVSLIKSYNV